MRSTRRRQSTVEKKDANAPPPRYAALQRQLKELIFSREVSAIEEYEKQKEVKSFVAIGQPLMEEHVIDATKAARAAHADLQGREERRRVASRARSTEPARLR